MKCSAAKEPQHKDSIKTPKNPWQAQKGMLYFHSIPQKFPEKALRPSEVFSEKPLKKPKIAPRPIV
jgi:hypothetical protein